MNRYNWVKKWHNIYIHQRCMVLRLLGVTSEKGLRLLSNKSFAELDPSTQIAMKYLNKEDLTW